MNIQNYAKRKLNYHSWYCGLAVFALSHQILLALVLLVAVFITPQLRANNDDLRERLDKTVIPEVNLEEAEIGEALDWLRQAARRHDPENRRLNLLLDLDDQAKKRTITMQLTDIQIVDAIRYICYAGQLQYRITSQVVMISSNELPPEEMKTRFFRVAPNTLPETSDED